jgi:hypothetical protein
VELPDGNYALVPEAEEGGADTELQYMEVLLNFYITIYGCLWIYVQELKWNLRCMILSTYVITCMLGR